jgi:hypothetical protein
MKKLLLLTITLQIMLFATESIEEQFIQIEENQNLEGHVNYLEKKYYQVKTSNEKTLTINLTNLEADIDLYVSIDKIPSIPLNDCFSSNSKNKNEKCTLNVIPQEGSETANVNIMVYGFKDSSYILEVLSQDGLEDIPTLKDYDTKSSILEGESKLYQFIGIKGRTYTTTLSNLSADADLRVKIGKRANIHSFDCKSTNGGTKIDECSVTLTEDATVYVEVFGYRAASYAIKRTYTVNDKEIIDFAKSTCLKENPLSTDSVQCIDNTYAYTITHSSDYIEATRVHKVNMQEGTVTLLTTLDRNERNTHFINLKNTKLIGIQLTEDLGDKLDKITFYDPQTFNKLKSFIFGEEKDYTYDLFISMETIEDGKKLKLIYKSIDSNHWVEYESIYDISDTSKFVLISTTEH